MINLRKKHIFIEDAKHKIQEELKREGLKLREGRKLREERKLREGRELREWAQIDR